MGNKWSFKWGLRDVLLQHTYNHGPGALEWTTAVIIVVVMVVPPVLGKIYLEGDLCAESLWGRALRNDTRKWGRQDWAETEVELRCYYRRRFCQLYLKLRSQMTLQSCPELRQGGWVLITIIYWLNPTTLWEEYYYCYSHFTFGKSGPSEIKKLA